MSEELMNWKDQLNQIEVPVRLDAAIDQAIKRGKKEVKTNRLSYPRFGRKTRYTMMASVLCIGIITAGISSPVMATMLKQIPFIGSVFNSSGDSGLVTASKNGYRSTLNQSATDQGITITLNEMIVDGTRLSIGFTAKFDAGIDGSLGVKLINVQLGEYHSSFDATPLSDENIKKAGAPLRWHKVDDQTYTGVYNLYGPYPKSILALLPDTFDAKIQFKQIGNIHGNWSFTIPVSKSKADLTTQTVQPSLSKTVDGSNYTLDSITFSPSETKIDLTLSGKVMQRLAYTRAIFQGLDTVYYNSPQIQVTDDHGNQLLPLQDSSGIYVPKQFARGVNDTTLPIELLFDPINEKPGYLIVKLENNPKLEFKVPLKW